MTCLAAKQSLQQSVSAAVRAGPLSCAAAFVYHRPSRQADGSNQRRPCISPHVYTKQQRRLAVSPQAARTALEEMGSKGEFVRKESDYRKWVKPGSEFPPEAGRYHLYISWACPWASRCAAALYLKGLEDVIGLSATHPTWQRTRPNDPKDEHWGWTFASEEDAPFENANGQGKLKPKTGLLPDTVNHVKNIRDLYDKSGGTAGKFTVPILWDKKTGVIVNNESSEILRMFNTEFSELAQKPDLDLYPEHLRKSIEEVNEWVYPGINNGVYRSGFATSQEAYDGAVTEVFEALDKAEAVLSRQRYIAGDQFTEADIRLFCTLIRFDHVYVVYFKCNKRFINQYPNLREYTREIYQMPGMGKSVNIEHIKMHYFTSHPKLNYHAIVPVGPPHWWEEPHNRKK